MYFAANEHFTHLRDGSKNFYLDKMSRVIFPEADFCPREF